VDFCSHDAEDKYDVAIAMSYVLGYQLTNGRLIRFLNNVSKSLVDGGVFAFNFYHSSGIYGATLSPRLRKAKIDNADISCISSVSIEGIENCLKEHYTYFIEKENELIEIDIDELMRFFSLKELQLCLEFTGFRVEDSLKYCSDKKLTADDWNGFIVARKV
jgi:hypothetical protein